MADQVILMRNGCIEQMGSPEALYAAPATEFAARFLGTPPMNLVKLADIAGALPVHPRALGLDPDNLLLGVRPERASLGRNGSGVPATVEAVEYLGADTVLVCRIASAPFSARVPGRRANARRAETLEARPPLN